MSIPFRILIYFIVPVLAVLAWPLEYLTGQPWVAVSGVVLIVAVGAFVFLGRSAALTLAIFIMGLNAIVRLMMFFPHIMTNSGVVDWPYVITSLISIALAIWAVLRLDRPDIRVMMVA
jgi:hypothetical protein